MGLPLTLGKVTVSLLEAAHPIPEGETVPDDPSSGPGPLFEAVAPPDTFVKFIDVTWATGDRDVRALEAGGPKAVRRLDSGSLRLSVNRLPDGSAWIELSQARIYPGRADERSSLVMATETQLDEGAGLSVFTLLRELGAAAVGTKALVLGDSGRRSRYACAVVPFDDHLLPAVAFVLTRVLPLHEEYSGSQRSFL